VPCEEDTGEPGSQLENLFKRAWLQRTYLGSKKAGETIKKGKKAKGV